MTKTVHRSDAVDKHVGHRVHLRRKQELNISLGALAERIGVTYQQVQKYESGENRISSSRLVALSKALDVSILFFFQGLNDQIDAEIRSLKGLKLLTKQQLKTLENQVQLHIREGKK
jgi:transcriptional regulator with XRE-family HTH domain